MFLGSPFEFNLRDIQRACEGLLTLKQDNTYFCDTHWKDYHNSIEVRHAADQLILELTKKPSLDMEVKRREIKHLLSRSPPPVEGEIPCSLDISIEKSDPHQTSTTSESSPEKMIESTNSENRAINPMRLLKLLFLDRMRTDEDKQIILNLFIEKFSQSPIIDVNQIPKLYVTRDKIILGDIIVNRECEFDFNILKQGLNQNSYLILRKHLHVMKSLLMCVKFNWLGILIGNEGVGKTCVVQTFAQLMGKELKTMSVNSEMDTTEILGGFEQVRNFTFYFKPNLTSCSLNLKT